MHRYTATVRKNLNPKLRLDNPEKVGWSAPLILSLPTKYCKITIIIDWTIYSQYTKYVGSFTLTILSIQNERFDLWGVCPILCSDYVLYKFYCNNDLFNDYCIFKQCNVETVLSASDNCGWFSIDTMISLLQIVVGLIILFILCFIVLTHKLTCNLHKSTLKIQLTSAQHVFGVSLKDLKSGAGALGGKLVKTCL